MAVHAKFAVLPRASLWESWTRSGERAFGRAGPISSLAQRGADEVGSVLAGGKDAADLIRTAGAVPVNE